MQGAQGFWLREQRAAAARGAKSRVVAEHGEIAKYWPDAPRPKPNEPLDPGRPPDVRPGPTPARAPTRTVQPAASSSQSASNGSLEEVPKISAEDQAILDRFAQSDEIKTLRRQIRQDMTALENFLQEMTQKDPELMKAIATNQKTFLKMVTHGLAEEARSATKLEEEQPQPEPSELRATLKQKEAKKQLRTQRALQPSTSSLHTLALLHSPYSCAVCKATSATAELFLCSSCGCVRFCSRAWLIVVKSV